ncbi:Bacterial Ig-like domain 2 [Vibrio sp. B1REV9]|uniref:Ig-like domain-containing protein n=1 Tax=Vibrio sp. B1REV9 TaxID=2751179 RepID=UPI001AF0FF96|nr:Ig-like domain-containing protein [Vibrio sp. B1REV9]CAE6937546.1 Bacterial Ig-like domain 2 [Vibrio sp. B1REV9]
MKICLSVLPLTMGFVFFTHAGSIENNHDIETKQNTVTKDTPAIIYVKDRPDYSFTVYDKNQGPTDIMTARWPSRPQWQHYTMLTVSLQDSNGETKEIALRATKEMACSKGEFLPMNQDFSCSSYALPSIFKVYYAQEDNKGLAVGNYTGDLLVQANSDYSAFELPKIHIDISIGKPKPPKPTLTRLEVAGKDTLFPMQTTQMKAYAIYSDGSKKDVTNRTHWYQKDLDKEWVHDWLSYLSLTSDGRITVGTMTHPTGWANEVLTVNQCVNFDTKESCKLITIREPKLVDAKINIEGNSTTFAPGNWAQMHARGYFEDGSNSEINISNYLNLTSSNPTVATVNDKKQLNVFHQGVTTIIGHFSYKDENGNITNKETNSLFINVTEPTFNGVLITGDKQHMMSSSTTQLTAYAVYSDRKEQVTNNVQWVVQDPSIISISDDGVLSALSPGMASFYASYNGQTTCPAYLLHHIQVLGQPSELLFSNKTNHNMQTINKGDNYQISDLWIKSTQSTYAKLSDYEHSITFTSLNPDIVTVSSDGKVTAHGFGQTKVNIVSQINGKEYNLSLDIMSEPKLEKIDISATNDEIPLKHQVKLLALGLYENGSQQDLTNYVDWTVENKDIISIIQDDRLGNEGLYVRGDELGNSKLSACINNICNTHNIDIIENATDATGFKLIPSSVLLNTDTNSHSFDGFSVYSDGSIRKEDEPTIHWDMTGNDLIYLEDGTAIRQNHDSGITSVIAEWGNDGQKLLGQSKVFTGDISLASTNDMTFTPPASSNLIQGWGFENLSSVEDDFGFAVMPFDTAVAWCEYLTNQNFNNAEWHLPTKAEFEQLARTLPLWPHANAYWSRDTIENSKDKHSAYMLGTSGEILPIATPNDIPSFASCVSNKHP